MSDKPGEQPSHGNWLDAAAKSSAAIVWTRWTTMVGIPVAIGVLWVAVDRFSALEDVAAKLRETQAVVVGRLERAEEDIRTIMSTRYSAADAIRDQRTQTQVDSNQNRRLDVLEDRIGGDVAR